MAREVRVTLKVDEADYKNPLEAYEFLMTKLMDIGEDVVIDGLDGETWEDGELPPRSRI